MKKPRPITDVDRLLAYGDRIAGKPPARRRTHFRFGKLEVIVIEEASEPTTVYLANRDGAIVEATAAELAEAANAVLKLLANPPPMKRTSR
jgi:hypothetical protein